MNKSILLTIVGALFIAFGLSCGGMSIVPTNEPTCNEECAQINTLKEEILALQGTIDEINNLILSDFATCDESPGSNTEDPLLNKMCEVAQAATIEARIELKHELQLYMAYLQDQVDLIIVDLNAVIVDVEDNTLAIAAIQTSLANINTALIILETKIQNIESAIAVLQDQLAGIDTTIAGVMTEIIIGEENIGAGPLYESVLKRSDNQVITGYINGRGPELTTNPNPLSATKQSSTITVTTNGPHNLSIGNVVKLDGFSSGNGFLSAQINREFVIESVPTTTTFTITLNSNATKNGNFGGSAGMVTQSLGAGLGALWQSGNGTDTAVRTTSLGHVRYNFIVVEDSSGEGFICYDKVDSSADYTTLTNAACQTDGVATGTCACK